MSTDEPNYDYANWPFSPAEGYRVGANYLTMSLFVEKHRGTDAQPLYSLSETETTENGVTYPCARSIYLASKGEHDAMRKLVGSFKQWQVLKELSWFRKEWEAWHAEWSMIQAQEARELLKQHASDKGGSSAAKALWDDAKKLQVGRPRKSRAKADTSEAEDEDVSRVVALRGPR